MTISLFVSSCATSQLDVLEAARLEKLDEAANFLVAVSDEESGLVNTCQISAGEALNLLQPLHAMIDEGLKNGPYNLAPETDPGCEESCHCGMYADLASSTMMKESLFIKAKNLSRAQKVTCANKTGRWICKSKLLEKLKAEAESSNLSNQNAL